MSKILTIIKREYKESVYKKSFIITTLLTPVLMLALVFIPALLTRMDVENSYHLALVDHSGLIASTLQKKLDYKLSDGHQKFQFPVVSDQLSAFDSLKEELKLRVNSTELDGFIFIPAQVLDTLKVEFYARNVGDFDLNQQIKSAIDDILTDYRIHQSGIDPATIDLLTRTTEMKTFKLKKGEEEKESGFIQEYFSTFAMVFILYMTIIIYGVSIMRGVLQEKNSRVIEILLASANSFQLMVGKILGLGSVGLTQYVIWSLLAVSVLLFGTNLAALPAGLSAISPSIFLYFILFFLLGYFLFACIYAGIGALANTDQEAQQMSTPVVFLIIIPILVMTFITKNPDSTTSVVLSLIPFFAPILMFARVNISAPPVWQVWGSVVLLLITIILSMWISAKIYRVGMLMHGKRPTLPEIMRWIRVK
jgi:ABC-2 type transport system permease protein